MSRMLFAPTGGTGRRSGSYPRCGPGRRHAGRECDSLLQGGTGRRSGSYPRYSAGRRHAARECDSLLQGGTGRRSGSYPRYSPGRRHVARECDSLLQGARAVGADRIRDADPDEGTPVANAIRSYRSTTKKGLAALFCCRRKDGLSPSAFRGFRPASCSRCRGWRWDGPPGGGYRFPRRRNRSSRIRPCPACPAPRRSS